MSTSADKQSRRSSDDERADPAPRPSRRTFTAAYKLAMIDEYEDISAIKGSGRRRRGVVSPGGGLVVDRARGEATVKDPNEAVADVP